tara:strand:+ start:1408 stop:2835 length:1428 start_codon:yes stop_codon:yes gene_type:complete
MNITLDEAIEKLTVDAEEIGLEYFPINFEIVPIDVMLEVMSYGLPTRARHWSYGKSYEYQKINGEMGFSKVYEIVLNNNPSYAFLLDTNPLIANVMVAAHVIGHVHFFTNNYLFKQTDRKMVYQAAARAQRIEEYIEKYGIEKVEHFMNIAFSMDKHIDWHKGVHRKPYSGPKRKFKKKAKREFDDLLSKDKESVKEVVENKGFPPHKEWDLLWFFINYAPLESWQRDIFEIIREESFYFYPQFYTKIMNEGFASYIHAELMHRFDDIEPEDHLEFCKIHERVVQPGTNKLNINPYFLGFTIFNDIKKRWDKKYEDGESEIDGLQKIYKVVETEDDISFVKTYLTQELVDDLKMFAYKRAFDKSRNEFIQIESTDKDDVAEHVVSKLYNYMSPEVYIEKASSDGIELVHNSPDNETLDEKHLEKVMEYIYEIWGGIVNVSTKDVNGEEVNYTYDELGFSHISDDDLRSPLFTGMD